MKIKAILISIIFAMSATVYADSLVMPQTLSCTKTSTWITCNIPYPANKYFLINNAKGEFMTATYYFRNAQTDGSVYGAPQNAPRYVYCTDLSCKNDVMLTTSYVQITADIKDPHWTLNNKNYQCFSDNPYDCPYTNVPFVKSEENKK